MSATMTRPPEVAEYLDRVRAQLGDLPAAERDELMADVEASLLDAATDTAVPLTERLGSPEAFAGELRAAAGLAAPSAPPAPSRTDRLRRHARSLADATRDFAPAWWVLRAYVAVAAFALLTESGWAYRLQLVPVLSSADVTIVVGLSVLGLSVWLGRRGFRAMLVADVILAVAIVPVAIHLERQYRGGGEATVTTVVEPATQGLATDGRPIANIYAYDRTGKLLHDVRLYDETGAPLSVGSADPQQDPLRRTVRSASGARVLNAFPIRYFEAGSRHVARPDAAPRHKVAALRTPALRDGR
ncbi:MAG: HAAS signaling domain-containing protein [Solirubrobacteraceae bacterium]